MIDIDFNGVRQKKSDIELREKKSTQIPSQILLVLPIDFYVNLTLAAYLDRPKTCDPPKTPEKSSEFISRYLSSK